MEPWRAFTRRGGLRLAAFVFSAGLVGIFSTLDRDTAVADWRPPAARKPMSSLAFTGLDDGKPWNLSDHRGEIVLINVWASWCPPCREETPALVAVANRYRARGVAVVGVSMDDGTASVRQFVRRFQVPYTVVMAPSDSSISAVAGLPTSFLLDPSGRVAAVYIGQVTESRLRVDLDRLLAEQEPASSPAAGP